MKEITRDNIAIIATDIASISQSQYQYENNTVTLYKVDEDGVEVKAGDLVLAEDTGAETTYYLLDAEEAAAAQADPQAYVEETARNWAAQETWHHLELYRWGLEDPEDHAVAEDYENDCYVVIKKHYFGFWPISYASDDNEPIVFASASEAQAWIDNVDEGTYYLEYNEQGRPTYYIVAK